MLDAFPLLPSARRSHLPSTLLLLLSLVLGATRARAESTFAFNETVYPSTSPTPSFR